MKTNLVVHIDDFCVVFEDGRLVAVRKLPLHEHVTETRLADGSVAHYHDLDLLHGLGGLHLRLVAVARF